MPLTKSKHSWCNNLVDFLIDNVPQTVWFAVEESGEFEREFFAIGAHEQTVIVLEGSYWCCTNCGIFQEDVYIKDTKIFDSLDKGIEYFLACPTRTISRQWLLKQRNKLQKEITDYFNTLKEKQS